MDTSKQLALIARYTSEDFEAEPKSALVKLAANLIPDCELLDKPALVAALIELTKKERALLDAIPGIDLEAIKLNQLSTEESAELNLELAQFTANLWQDFRAIVMDCYKDGVWDEPKLYRNTVAFANRVMNFLNYQGLAVTTKTRYRTHIVNALKEYADNEKGKPYHNQITGALEETIRQIGIALTDVTREKNKRDIVNRAERKTNKVDIDFEYLYNFSKLILSSLDKLPPSEWKKVSIALAIATGRRMSEIHLTATEFKLVTEDEFKSNPALQELAPNYTHLIWFTGQLKAKGLAGEYFLENPSYAIPTLIDRQLVIKGREWLIKNEKVVETPEKADTRYSKDLSQSMKWLRGLMKIDHKNFTYKGLRSIYSDVAHQLFNPDKTEMNQYIGLILGHGRREMMLYGTSKMVDYETPESYKADFRVINVNCPK